MGQATRGGGLIFFIKVRKMSVLGETYKLKLFIGRKYRKSEISKEIYLGVTDALDVIDQLVLGERNGKQNNQR